MTNTAWCGTEEPPARFIAGLPDFRLRGTRMVTIDHGRWCGVMWYYDRTHCRGGHPDRGHSGVRLCAQHAVCMSSVLLK